MHRQAREDFDRQAGRILGVTASLALVAVAVMVLAWKVGAWMAGL